MAGASITMDATGIAALTGFLASLTDADFLSLMTNIAMAGEAFVSESFEGEHDPDGMPWFPSMAALAEGRKTLSKGGFLSGSVESNVTAGQAEVGTNLIYARIHQEGFTGSQTVSAHKRTITQAFGKPLKSPVEVMMPTATRNFHMPQRSFLGWGHEALKEANALAEDFLAAMLPSGAAS